MNININLLSFIIQSVQAIVSNMGRASKSQYIEIQNPKKSPFNNMDLVWKTNVRHERAHIIKVKCAYIPHAWISEFLKGEQSHEDSPNGMEHLWVGTFTRKCKNAKNPKPPWPFLVWCFIIHFCYMKLVF